MINNKSGISILIILISLLSSCEDITEKDKFRRPDWLPGRLYTAIELQEELSLFAECLQLTGLDTIIDVSGSWTAFAPSDDAMEAYLLEHNYDSVSDIPPKILEQLTEYHILQNPWTLEQLKVLGYNGWREKNDDSWSSFAFKRQTIFKNPNETYWVQKKDGREIILIDSSLSRYGKKVFEQSRKYIPVFYDDYMTANSLSSEDFRFYFNREFESGSVYYAGARIIEADIFAENGFVHIVDRVVEPMLNAKEMLEREMSGETYKLFLEMVYWYYPEFFPNIVATFNQPSVLAGGIVDTLWDLHFTELDFDLHQEVLGYYGGSSNETLILHNGMIIPTDNAFRSFVDGILTQNSGYPHWRDIYSLPKDVLDLVIPNHFFNIPIYPSSSSYATFFDERARFHQAEADIIRREFGSNCTFIGLDSYIPDKLFTSVTAPVFLRPPYSNFRRAMTYSRVADYLAQYEGELCFFPISDYALGVDSSLIINWLDIDDERYYFTEYVRDMESMANLSRNTIFNRILGQVGLAYPDGSAIKEFIPTLAGNYIIWNNGDNTVQGQSPCTLGYNGDIITICNPIFLGNPSGNGEVYAVRHWFNYESRSLYSVLSQYERFFELLEETDLYERGSFTFLDASKYYTIFAPSDAALSDPTIDTLDQEELKSFLKYHFIEGSLVFTDNKKAPGIYQTVDGEQLELGLGPDLIEIIDESGQAYISITENSEHTNIMATQNSSVHYVIHETDQILSAPVLSGK